MVVVHNFRLIKKIILSVLILLSYWNWSLLGWMLCMFRIFPVNILPFHFLRIFTFVIFFIFSFHRGLLERIVLWDGLSVSLLFSHIILKSFEVLKFHPVPLSLSQSEAAFALCLITHFYRLFFIPIGYLNNPLLPFIYLNRFWVTCIKFCKLVLSLFKNLHVDYRLSEYNESSSTAYQILQVFDDPHLTLKLFTEHGLTSLDLCRLDSTSKRFHIPSPFGNGFLSLTELSAFEICRKHFDKIPNSNMHTLLQKCNFSYKLLARYIELVQLSVQMRGRIATGSSFNLILSNDGHLYLSGKDGARLISSNSVKYSIPKLVRGLEHIRIRKIAAGASHVVLVSGSGEVYTSGIFPGEPKLLTGLESVQITSAATGSDLNLLISTKGEVYSFGGFSGSVILGNGRVTTEPVSVPQKLNSLTGLFVLQACVGMWHSLLLLRLPGGKHAVYSFGMNHEGALGLGDEFSEVLSPRVIPFFDDVHVISLSAGYVHCAAIDAEGLVYTWGRGWEGQLGHGYYQNEPMPVRITTPKFRNFMAINVACGSHSTIVLGLGKAIALGGIWRFKGEDLNVASKSNLIYTCSKNRYAISEFQYLAISDSNEYFVWGKDEHGQLGLGMEVILDKTFFGLDKISDPVKVWF